ncbi:carbon-nitrogen hydrolase family protein [Citromicrobium sp. JLT1363]|uniref:carbon-nitrogen hydrolase family protein n=1 Tax=Citromicrobium sp. JLT1363 TaxID=517722 RepID=UPI00030A6278|nr:carbon-nitrogen hydrolase family protein [Citromicrobium sp. JLT1363]
MTKIAVFQMTSGIDPEVNANALIAAMADARAGGADMLFAPEMALLLDRDRKRAGNTIESADYSALVERICAAAKEHAVWVTFGLPVRLDGGKLANRSLLIAPSGEIAGQYDKLHMFDVDLDSGESWRESNAYQPGDALSVTDDTPAGRLGLTICYDIRFPALFDALGRAKCDMIAIPAAFTVPTGTAHWHTLVRARAIEASAFVVAAAQVGEHADGRKTYGHSLVVDPWGEVLLDMGSDEAGVGFADIEAERIAQVRKQVPSLANRRAIPDLDAR